MNFIHYVMLLRWSTIALIVGPLISIAAIAYHSMDVPGFFILAGIYVGILGGAGLLRLWVPNT